MSDINYGRILRRHGESVYGYVLDEEEFQRAVEQAIDEGAATHVPSGITLDFGGRIFLNGVHVGWLNKKCDKYELMSFAEMLGATVPIIEDMLPIAEPEKAVA